jgi:hypothetical protein
MPAETTIQLRQGTSSQWAAANGGLGPVLASGEVGFETDTFRFKIGNGTSAYNALYYPNQGIVSTNTIFTTAIPSTFTSAVGLTKISPLSSATAGFVKIDSSGNLTSDNTTYLTSAYLTGYLTQSAASTTYAALSGATFTGTVNGITKTMVGLGNVDNTSDVNKPVSTAQQTALDGKVSAASPTFTGKVTLPTGTNSLVPIVLPYSQYRATGTNITSGALENSEGTLLFTSPMGQGVVPAFQYLRTYGTIDYTLANSTAVQSAFGKGITLSTASYYEFEMVLYIYTSNNAAKNVIISFPGLSTTGNGARYDAVTYISTSDNGSGNGSATIASNQNAYFATRASNAASTNSNLSLLPSGGVPFYEFTTRIKGFYSCQVGNSSEYFYPSLQFSGAAPGTAFVAQGSYVKIWNVSNGGDGSASYIGKWFV